MYNILMNDDPRMGERKDWGGLDGEFNSIKIT